MQHVLRVSLSICLFFLVAAPLHAQRPKIKFGDVKAEDFNLKAYPIDTGASGIIISDIGASTYEADNGGGFNVMFKRHTRIRLLKRTSFDEATISIPLYYASTLEEKLIKIEAVTINLENGQLVETKLDKNSIFLDKVNNHYNVKKFTMPNLKEGCIIDVQYTVQSPYERDLKTWYFQNDLPTLYSEYTTAVPAIYDFVVLNQGYHPFSAKTQKSVPATFNIVVPSINPGARSDRFTFTTEVNNRTWAMENVPFLRKEDFTTTLLNHIAKIEFQLSSIRYPDQPVRPVMNNWISASTMLMERSDFGENVVKNGWCAEELKSIVPNKELTFEAAQKIFTYVRDNFTCNSHSALFTRSPLKKVFQAKSGNVAEINLLLTALLAKQGFEVHPVVLSTRDNGKAYELYPILDKLNYVVCQLKFNDENFLLDASHSRLGFGKLHSDCYNGYARVIDHSPFLINLEADSLVERKFTSVVLINKQTAGMEGSFKAEFGANESYNLRETLSKKSEEEYFKTYKTALPTEFNVNTPVFDSIKNPNASASLQFKLDFDMAGEDIIYFNPLIKDGFKENPFKSSERLYPVEMEAAMDRTYLLRMDVPKGYKVDELPKSVRVMYNEDEGMFEYIFAKTDDLIQLRCRLKLVKATYLPEDYESLRDFFAFVVKKQSEQIVFKKL